MCVLLAAAAVASAQSFGVSADVVLGCALPNSTQKTGLDFGVLNFGTRSAVQAGVIGTSVVATGGGPMQVECTQGMTFQLSVDAGQHASGGQRRLQHASLPANLVSYALYTSSGLTESIPVGSSVGVTVPANGQVTLPIYATATLPGQNLWPGIYSDSLQVVLSW